MEDKQANQPEQSGENAIVRHYFHERAFGYFIILTEVKDDQLVHWNAKLVGSVRC